MSAHQIKLPFNREEVNYNMAQLARTPLSTKEEWRVFLQWTEEVTACLNQLMRSRYEQGEAEVEEATR